ncbi:hypothetical protein TorRG33x02_250650 [Trema orientale]|uniref:Uncharacterized protein n=1 Tax=Trema orientale TaxID=63057 RepID=A0A2P5DIF8_TREOI|nr:hypothetical protein TorRG33x02_250650 [Trema orientale]
MLGLAKANDESEKLGLAKTQWLRPVARDYSLGVSNSRGSFQMPSSKQINSWIDHATGRSFKNIMGIIHGRQ